MTASAARTKPRRVGPARPRRPRRGARRAACTSSSPPGAGTHRHRGAAMRVVIADDSVIVCEGIVSLLTRAGASRGGRPGGQPGRADAPPSRSTRPDVSIVDIRMPPTHTDEGLRAPQHPRARPGLAVSDLSQHVELGIATRAAGRQPRGPRILAQGPRLRRRRLRRPTLQRVAEGGSARSNPQIVSRLLSADRRNGPLRDADRRASARFSSSSRRAGSNPAIAEHM